MIKNSLFSSLPIFFSFYRDLHRFVLIFWLFDIFIISYFSKKLKHFYKQFFPKHLYFSALEQSFHIFAFGKDIVPITTFTKTTFDKKLHARHRSTQWPFQGGGGGLELGRGEIGIPPSPSIKERFIDIPPLPSAIIIVAADRQCLSYATYRLCLRQRHKPCGVWAVVWGG